MIVLVFDCMIFEWVMFKVVVEKMCVVIEFIELSGEVLLIDEVVIGVGVLCNDVGILLEVFYD